MTTLFSHIKLESCSISIEIMIVFNILLAASAESVDLEALHRDQYYLPMCN